MATLVKRDVPWHLWVVGILALLFTGFGAYDYIMTQVGDREYLAAMTEPYGYGVEAALAYFAAFPLWAEFFWAIGVWSAVAGAVLLLLRSRFAFPAFVLSIVGLLVMVVYQTITPLAGAADSVATYVFTAVVVIIMALLAYYAWAMRRRGVLR